MIQAQSCQWEVDTGQVCGEPATATIKLRDKVGAGRVPVCRLHKAEHSRKAAAIRTANKK